MAEEFRRLNGLNLDRAAADTAPDDMAKAHRAAQRV